MVGKRQFILVHEQAKANALAFIDRLEVRKDKPWRIEISEKLIPRTLEQNALQHRIYAAVAAETGYTLPEMKDIMVRATLGTESYEWNGEIHERRKSTKGLSVKEGSELIELLYRFCAENGFQV